MTSIAGRVHVWPRVKEHSTRRRHHPFTRVALQLFFRKSGPIWPHRCAYLMPCANLPRQRGHSTSTRLAISLWPSSSILYNIVLLSWSHFHFYYPILATSRSIEQVLYALNRKYWGEPWRISEVCCIPLFVILYADMVSVTIRSYLPSLLAVLYVSFQDF